MSNKQAILPVCYISALAQLARFAPEAFEQKSDVIMAFLVKRILMLPSPVDAVRDFLCAHLPIH
jgi:sister-chromatid-cohesion protein PDS5